MKMCTAAVRVGTVRLQYLPTYGALTFLLFLFSSHRTGSTYSLGLARPYLTIAPLFRYLRDVLCLVQQPEVPTVEASEPQATRSITDTLCAIAGELPRIEVCLLGAQALLDTFAGARGCSLPGAKAWRDQEGDEQRQVDQR
jgi:hypothetical protein